MAKREPPRKNWFGTPYAPKYTGSEPKPQGKAAQEASEEKADVLFRFVYSDDVSLNTSAIMEKYRDLMAQSFANIDSGIFGFTADPISGYTVPSGNPSGKTPPYSYTSAREAVKAWISVAPEQAFDDVIGNEKVLAQLRDAIEAPVKQAELYAAYGMKMPKGALLSGPPGCGKTLFARAAASAMKTLYGGDGEFILLNGTSLQSKYVNETEKRISAIFKFAREYKAFHGRPLLVFIDEAEVLLPDRTGRARHIYHYEEFQVATFLTEMDGIHESGAFVMLATNRPEALDEALLRDGRCDLKLVVKRPTMEAARAILQKAFTGVLLGEDPLEVLVEAAVESLFDPSRVLLEGHMIAVNSADPKKTITLGKHFLLEHIVSGAMVVGIPARATRIAFARDKASGTTSGVSFADVVKAVDQVFSENKGLDHGYALDEFKEAFMGELKERLER